MQLPSFTLHETQCCLWVVTAVAGATQPVLMLQVIEDFALVHFLPLAIEERQSVERVVSEVDKATGYVFAGLAQPGHYTPELLYGAAAHDLRSSNVTPDFQERFVSRSDRDAGSSGGVPDKTSVHSPIYERKP